MKEIIGEKAWYKLLCCTDKKEISFDVFAEDNSKFLVITKNRKNKTFKLAIDGRVSIVELIHIINLM